MPSDNILALDPGMKVRWMRVGGIHRILVIDNFYLNPRSVLDLAMRLKYTDSPDFVGGYPGVRAHVFLEQSHVRAAIAEQWGVDLKPKAPHDPVIFSMVTQHRELTPAQRMAHVDGYGHLNSFVYLNEAGTGGTAFYRHTLTGLCSAPAPGSPEFIELAEKCDMTPNQLTQHKLTWILFNPLFAKQGSGFLNEGNQFWEFLEVVEGRFNRLVSFDGACFHSQYMPEGGSEPGKVPRLTQSIFSLVS